MPKPKSKRVRTSEAIQDRDALRENVVALTKQWERAAHDLLSLHKEHGVSLSNIRRDELNARCRIQEHKNRRGAGPDVELVDFAADELDALTAELALADELAEAVKAERTFRHRRVPGGLGGDDLIAWLTELDRLEKATDAKLAAFEAGGGPREGREGK